MPTALDFCLVLTGPPGARVAAEWPRHPGMTRVTWQVTKAMSGTVRTAPRADLAPRTGPGHVLLRSLRQRRQRRQRPDEVTHLRDQAGLIDSDDLNPVRPLPGDNAGRQEHHPVSAG